MVLDTGDFVIVKNISTLNGVCLIWGIKNDKVFNNNKENEKVKVLEV